MSNRLSIKLLMPTFLIGMLSIITIFLLAESLSKTATMLLLLVMVFLQLVIGYLYSDKKLTQRLTQLQQFIDQVASVDEAPSKLVKDENSDDLAKVTNDLASFIANLAVLFLKFVKNLIV